MSNSNKQSIGWGLMVMAPDEAAAKWGARAILRGSDIDLVHDRQSIEGSPEARKKLVRWLNGTAFPAGRTKLVRLIQNGEVRPDKGNRIVLYEDDTAKLIADTHGSHGYLYIGAWLKTDEEAA